MFNKFGLYFRTIKHLKPIQVRYRVWYSLRKRFRKLTHYSYPLSISKEGHNLELMEGCQHCDSYQPSAKTFIFLNQSHRFENKIDWNFNKYGKLWAYNLNYFDFLLQEDLPQEHGLALIDEFNNQIEENRVGLGPYPISLRGMNWIRFLSKHRIVDTK